MRGVLPSSFAAIAIFFTASDGMSKILPAPVIPELEKGSQVSEEERAKLAHARGFALTYRGQLDRLAFERYVSNEQDKVALVQNELVISSTEERDETMFRFGQDWLMVILSSRRIRQASSTCSGERRGGRPHARPCSSIRSLAAAMRSRRA